MTNIKIPTSKPYQDFIIEKLKNSEHAAGFLTAILEEENPEPELLKNVIAKVIEAKYQNQDLSNEAKLCYEKLNHLLTKSGCAEIYGFIELLNSLGFEISIHVKEYITEVEESETGFLKIS
jgi:DNA-binding phage protein